MRFRGLISTVVFLAVGLFAQGQVLDPVQWNVSVEKTGDKEATIIFDAVIEDHWHLYSQHMDPDKIGPIPTSFDFDKSADYSLIGETSEPKAIVDYDPNFELELGFFENEAQFVQKVAISGGDDTRLVGTINFMTCDDEKCIFPDPVSFDLGIGESMTTIVDKAAAGGGHGAEGGILDPVDWTWSSKKVNEGEYELTFHADIEPHWHLYSQFLESQFGPVPTSFSIDEKENNISLIGKTKEGTPLVSYDPNFEMDLSYFETSADFKQRIKVTNGNDGTVSGFLSFMVCDDSKCLPPEDIDFKIDLKTGKAIGLVSGGGERAPDEFVISTVDLDRPAQDCGDSKSTDTKEEKSGLWTLFLLGFGGGLIALLTPCVFPMIPLTVSFFTKGSKDKATGIRNAFIYGFFIFLIYILLSVPFHLLDNLNPDILNEISTNVALNIFFFVIFLVFAFSFFGFYEITLPSSFTNKMDDKASTAGGMVGIFFMALTLALVSFSCTGPILGSLLAGSLTSDGGAIQLTAGMGGFGAALALPFALFAAFPGWMNSLPQSGGWLNSVKVVLGFAEVALAFKFLSNADLVAHWELIKIEPFLIIWILCAGGIALYLFGLIKFPHDSPIKKLSPMRMILGVIAVAFTIYLASGFRYNEKSETFTSLELLSGLAPPVGHSFIYPKHCPNGLDCFHDYDKGMAYAKEVNKPVLIDFTGYACVNCRKMEEQVWPKPGVVDMIEGDFVLISLYVDDKEELPAEEQIEIVTQSGKSRKLKTIGNKWSVLQSETFKNNSQPYYALLSADGQLLNSPVGYTPDIEEYKGFLECGLEANRQLATRASID